MDNACFSWEVFRGKRSLTSTIKATLLLHIFYTYFLTVHLPGMPVKLILVDNFYRMKTPIDAKHKAKSIQSTQTDNIHPHTTTLANSRKFEHNQIRTPITLVSGSNISLLLSRLENCRFYIEILNRDITLITSDKSKVRKLSILRLISRTKHPAKPQIAPKPINSSLRLFQKKIPIPLQSIRNSLSIVYHILL